MGCVRLGSQTADRFNRADIFDHFATAKFDLFAVGGQTALDLDNLVGIDKADAITGGGHVGVHFAFVTENDFRCYRNGVRPRFFDADGGCALILFDKHIF